MCVLYCIYIVVYIHMIQFTCTVGHYLATALSSELLLSCTVHLISSAVSLIGNFMPGGENGTIMKKSSENERKALQGLNEDSAMRNFVPEYRREVEHKGNGISFLLTFLRICITEQSSFSFPGMRQCVHT